jgi:hypothetical protein
VTALLCGHVDDAEWEQWLWIVQLLDSIERSARRALRETVVIASPRLSRRQGSETSRAYE